MTTQEVKKILVAKKRELATRQVRREDIAIEQRAEVLDEIQQSADRMLALDSLTRNWETAALVSQALQRIEKGTYGTCLSCEEEIGPRRLAAIPWARYCIHCQELADKEAVDTPWAEAA